MKASHIGRPPAARTALRATIGLAAGLVALYLVGASAPLVAAALLIGAGPGRRGASPPEITRTAHHGPTGDADVLLAPKPTARPPTTLTPSS
jgi:hypothetical protein